MRAARALASTSSRLSLGAAALAAFSAATSALLRRVRFGAAVALAFGSVAAFWAKLAMRAARALASTSARLSLGAAALAAFSAATSALLRRVRFGAAVALAFGSVAAFWAKLAMRAARALASTSARLSLGVSEATLALGFGPGFLRSPETALSVFRAASISALVRRLRLSGAAVSADFALGFGPGFLRSPVLAGTAEAADFSALALACWPRGLALVARGNAAESVEVASPLPVVTRRMCAK